MGVAQAFLIASHAEMCGLPLPLYLVAWWIGQTEFAQDHSRGHAQVLFQGLGHYGFSALGQTDHGRVPFHAITAERRPAHSAGVLITSRARVGMKD